MQNALKFIEVVRSRGERRLELRRVYRKIQNRELFLLAYAKLYANDGALTPGTSPNDTVDGMSLARIDHIIERLKTGTYEWKPVRRTYRCKKSGGKRPIGMPGWNDKLVQEALRMVLGAYYEPQFSNSSHGFRQGHGCHTALRSILTGWKGTKWFIEGDIKGCFDNISHEKLLQIIGRSIKDERLLKLLRGMLEVGYQEDWQHYATYSGTPQGGILSPLLANIFLNELDEYIEQELIPQYTRGRRRRKNPEYNRLTYGMQKAWKEGDKERYKALKKERDRVSFGDPNDPDYRRLRYVRYADDFLLGFTGPKAEAKEIKRKVGEFLRTIGLTMAEGKTLITHATEGRARFLGYEVHMAKADSRRAIDNGTGKKRRTINGTPMLSVPEDVIKTKTRRYTQKGKPHHRAELLNNSDYDIVTTYGMEFQGLVNYYVMAQNVTRLYRLKHIYQVSLVKTLAAKHKRSARWVYRKYGRKTSGIKAIVAEVPREDKKPLVAKFGAKPIHYDKWATLSDNKARLWSSRSELVDRLTAGVCELCGDTTSETEGHHIRKLKDLQRRYSGRPNPPRWVVRMIELRRKTLMVCSQCHKSIHAGTYDGPKLK